MKNIKPYTHARGAHSLMNQNICSVTVTIIYIYIGGAVLRNSRAHFIST